MYTLYVYTLANLANAIERCVRSGDAVLCQITLTTCSDFPSLLFAFEAIKFVSQHSITSRNLNLLITGFQLTCVELSREQLRQL